ncbi:MAG: DUF421 domain-containing protein [Litorimonas sp.]
MSESTVPLDIARMILGDQSSLFYIEILLRTLIIYAYTFVLLRVFGRRTKASMSIMDVIVIVALGSAVGDVAFYPNVPILHCLVVVTLIVGLNKALINASQKSHRLRDLIEGDATVLVRRGVIQMDALNKVSIGRQALLEMMREKGICNLGQVDLGVLEPSCALSIFSPDEPRLGLSILPPDPVEADDDLDNEHEQIVCCSGCGLVRSNESRTCFAPNCHETKRSAFERPRYAL